MKASSSRWLSALFLFSFLALILLNSKSVASAQRLNPITRAWEQARAAGSYEFVADVEQTLVPQASPANIGQSSEQIDIRIEGGVQLPDQAEMVLLFEGIGDALPPIGIVHQGGETFLRQGSALTAVDTPSTMSAPNGDFLAYLAGATAVEQLAEVEISGQTYQRYTFEVNGRAIEQYVVEQIQTSLEGGESGIVQTPIATAALLRGLGGTGELWIDEEGYPRRQLLDLEMGGLGANFDSRMQITIDFSRFGQADLDAPLLDIEAQFPLTGPQAPAVPAAAVTNSPSNALPLAQSIMLAAAAVFLVGLAIWLYQRTGHRLHAPLTISLALIFLFNPVLQAFAHRPVQAAVHSEERPDIFEAMGLAESEEEAAASLTDPQILFADINPAVQCGDGSQAADTDGDGLDDFTENCLGTSRFRADTDGDGLNDGVETAGISFDGTIWPSDPFNPDSNDDGVGDGDEWGTAEGGTAFDSDIDQDGIPNAVDADNDNDGVPDAQDISPNSRTAFATRQSLQVNSGSYNAYQTIDLQVVPQNAEHLRFTVSPLDWPADTEGQVQDIRNRPNDIRLVPMLVIQANLAPDKGLAQKYGLTVLEKGSGFELFAPLSPVTDGGRIVAFQTRIPYDPASLGVIILDAEMVWTVNKAVGSTSQMIHLYKGESFRLTGFQVNKSAGFEAAIIGTPDQPENDQQLFNLAFGLNTTFLNRLSFEGQSPADTPLQALGKRLTNVNTPPEQKWGITTTIAFDGGQVYGHQDEAYADISGSRTADFLDTHFGAQSTASLLFAYEERTGAGNMDDQNQLTPSNPTIHLDNIDLLTMRTVQIGMFERVGASWSPLSPEDSIERVEDRYADASGSIALLQPDYPEVTAVEVQTSITWLYLSWLSGFTSVMAINDTVLYEEFASDLSVYARLNQPAYANDLGSYFLKSADLLQLGEGLIFSPNAVDIDQIASARPEGEFPVYGKGFAALWAYKQTGAGGAGSFPTKEVIKTVLTIKKVYSAVKLVKTAYKASVGVTRTARALQALKYTQPLKQSKLGIAGLVLEVALIWVAFGIGTDFSNPLAVKTAVTYAVVATAVAVALFAISLNPVGAVIVALFFIIDLIIFLTTGTSIYDEAVKAIAGAFYSASVDNLTILEDATFENVESTFRDPEIGPRQGNRFTISGQFTGKIDNVGPGGISDLRNSYVYGNFYGSASNASAANVNQQSCSVAYSSADDWHLDCTYPVGVIYNLHTATNNVPLTMSTDVYGRTLYRECERILFVTKCKTKTTDFSEPSPPETIYLDVFPRTLDEFVTWNVLNQPDVDMDGRLNGAERAVCANPAAQQCTSTSLWDTDGDTLPDGFETLDTNGTVAWLADSDGDGLRDDVELDLGTQPDAADSDGDGLLDGEEVALGAAGGWDVLLANGQTLRVYSDPKAGDIDGDGLSDATERANGTSPYAYNDAPRVGLTAEQQLYPTNRLPGFILKPGDTLDVATGLLSVGPLPIDSTFEWCFPDLISSASVAPLSGNRLPLLQTGSCPGGGTAHSWDFYGSYTLQLNEVVSTTATLTIDPAISIPTVGEITARLPYDDGSGPEILTQAISITVDTDLPLANFIAPTDNLLIGGGISDYVIGGEAFDPTSYISEVEIDLPAGGGTVAAVGEEVWAYTWNLPADGVYTLHARAIDYVGHVSPDATVQVQIDNTPPVIDFQLADNSVVSGTAADTIVVPLSGTVSDNLSGVARLQISIDNRPWQEILASGGSWSFDWEMPDEASAQGEHNVRLRAFDLANNLSGETVRTLIVDVVPPTSQLTNNAYLANPPFVQTGETLTLKGVANDAGNAPQPTTPQELVGTLSSLDDATIWLQPSTIFENDAGVAVTWLGDVNGDRLADMAIGFPAAESGSGEIFVVNGQAGDWPAPPNSKLIADSRSSFLGQSGAAVGSVLTAVGDVDGDAFDDFVVGDPANQSAYLLYGRATPFGRDVLLDRPQTGLMTQITASSGTGFGLRTAAAGDVNGDGYADVWLSTDDASYLMLGEAARVPEWDVVVQAAAIVGHPAAGDFVAGVGDLDGDQRDEFVLAAPSEGQSHLFAGDATFSNLNPSRLTKDDAVNSFVATSNQIAPLGDVDGDGLADFMLENGSAPQLIFGDAGGSGRCCLSFGGLSPAASGQIVGVGNVHDDSNERLNDILISTADGNAYLFLGENGLSAVSVAATLLGVNSAAPSPYPTGADLNADGSADLLLVPSDTLTGLAGMSDASVTVADPNALPRPLDVELSPSFAAPQAGVVFTVDDDGCAGCYTTIQAAVDAAADADIINIQPGVYGSFHITGTDQLIVQGVDPDAVFIDGGGGQYAMRVSNAIGVSISNLTVFNAERGLWLDAAGIGGYEVPANLTSASRLLFRDVTHAVYADRRSTVNLSQSTLVGSPTATDETIFITADPDPDLNGTWATMTTSIPVNVAAGGSLTVKDSDELYILPGGNTSALYTYNTVTDSFIPQPNAPALLGAGSSATGQNGNLYSLSSVDWTGPDGPNGSTIYDVAILGNDVYVVASEEGWRWNGITWTRIMHGLDSLVGTDLSAVEVVGSKILFAGQFEGFEDASNNNHQHSGLALFNPATNTYEGVWGYTDRDVDVVAVDPVTLDIYAAHRDANNGDDWRLEKIVGASTTSLGEFRSCNTPPCGDGTVGELGLAPNGDMYATGGFNTVIYNGKGVLAHGVAYYDVSEDAWHGVGSADYEVRNYDQSSGDIEIIDPLGISSFSIPDPWVNGGAAGKITFLDGNPIFGASTTVYTPTGQLAVNNIVRWNGTSWDDMGGGLNNGFSNMATFGDEIVVAGSFTATASGIPLNQMATYSDAEGWQTFSTDSACCPNGRFFRHIELVNYGRILIGGTFSNVAGEPHRNLVTVQRDFSRFDGNTWQSLAPLPAYLPAALAGDPAGSDIYAIVENGRTGGLPLWRYSVGSNSWTQISISPSSPTATRPSMTWASDVLFVLPGDGSQAFFAYDISGDSWSTLADIPSPVGAGKSISWDGRDYLYVIAGGGGRYFYRYSISGDSWQTLGDNTLITTDDDDTPNTVDAGGESAILNQVLYAMRGNTTGDFWRYEPVGVVANKLILDQNLFVAPANSTAAAWSNIDPAAAPDEFGIVINGSNQWVGGSGSLVWAPAAVTQTFAAAAFLNPPQDSYRLTAGSVVTAGYHAYRPDATVSTTACAGCFSSVQAAVDSGANAIFVEPGFYTDSFYLVHGLNLVGTRADLTIIEGSGSATVTAEGVNASLSRLTLTSSSGGNGLQAEQGADVTVSRTIIRDTTTAVALDGSTTSAELINSNLVKNNAGVVSTAQAGFNMRNSIIAYNTGIGLSHAANASQSAHTYNLFWQNGADFGQGAGAGAGELFLDPLFIDLAADDYRTTDFSPVIDAGDPGDPAPANSGTVDIGFLEQGVGGIFVDDDYCPTCANDGLAWGVDAFATIQEALDAAEARLIAVGDALLERRLTVAVAPGSYSENVTVPSYVSLSGSGPDQTVLTAAAAGSTVTFENVTQATLSGFHVQGASGAGSANVMIRTGSLISVTRSLLTGSTGGAAAIRLEAGSTADIQFNTLVVNEAGIQVDGAQSWAAVQNNIVADSAGAGLASIGGGRFFNDYNLFYNNAPDFGSGLVAGDGDLTGQNPQFAPSFYRLTATSPAVDRADLLAEVPAGGGVRADIGYHELLAAPVTVLLGDIDNSRALANSGVALVEVGVVAVADGSQPVTATLPSSWTPVTLLGSAGDTVRFWSADVQPDNEGIYRIYSRATDAEANGEADETVWFEGTFLADGVAPVVTSPTASSSSISPLELRATTSDFVAGEFTIEQVGFVVNGQPVAAEWVPEPWDAAAQQPRAFRALVDLSVGSYTVTAVATDRSGRTTTSTPLALTITGQAFDTTPPGLTFTGASSPGDNNVIVLEGTAGDDTALLGVEASFDNGQTWHPAALSGSDWTLTYQVQDDQEYVTYATLLRSRDVAGNVVTQTTTVTFDDQPPRGLGTLQFDPPLGSHLDFAQTLSVTWDAPFDGSGVAEVQVLIDQLPESEPTTTVFGTSTGQSLNANGQWYAHVAMEDSGGNRILRHYGPWYVGDISGACPDRRQSIVLDGVLNFEVDEWLPAGELLDDDERPLNRDTQLLFAAWDAEHIYLAWQGGWWNTDGSLWAYLDVTGDGSTIAQQGGHVLPFAADYAVEIASDSSGTLWQYSGGSWVDQGAVDFIQGDSGGTEIALPFGTNSYSTNVRLFAYAEDDQSGVWSTFPTTNPLSGSWTSAYSWANLCSSVLPNANQPQSKNLAVSVSSPQSTGTPWGPGETLSYAIEVTNNEISGLLSGVELAVEGTSGLGYQSSQGAVCTDCTPGAGSWTLALDPFVPGETQTVIVTGTLETQPVLAAVDQVTTTVTVVRNAVELAVDSLVHAVDGKPPTVTLTINDDLSILPGAQTLSGAAADAGGSGIDYVQVRPAGGSWSPAAGTTSWTFDLTVPLVTTYTVELRAFDQNGNASPIVSVPLVVDQTAPQIDFSLPVYVTDTLAALSGTAADPAPVGGSIADVALQFEDPSAPFASAIVYDPDQAGQQGWLYGWTTPSLDGQVVQVRAQATDAAGNQMVTGWLTTTVDTRLPVITATQMITTVLFDEYYLAAVGPAVLSGQVTDNLLDEVWIELHTPASEVYIFPQTISGDEWAYDFALPTSEAGLYLVWIHATDLAGNRQIEGPFEIVVEPTADLLLDKRVSTGAAVPGDEIQYTLTFTNSGLLTVDDAVLSDPLPGELVNPSFESSVPVTTTGSTPYRWLLPPLTPSMSGMITVTAEIQNPLTGTVTITNSATLSSAGVFDLDGGNNGDSAVVAAADVAISGLAASNSGPVAVNQPVLVAAAETVGTNVHYSWDLGDGSSGSGSQVTHTFAAPGIYTATVTATNGTSQVTAETEIEVVEAFYTYLPGVMHEYFPPAPDLVVSGIKATTGGVEITIENIGGASVTDGFWVELYLNPDVVPSEVNQIWPDLGDRGATWGVTAEALPLEPGETLVLTLEDDYFVAEYSVWRDALRSGTVVYAQVDSAAASTTYGGVQESHEISGGAYNNVSGPVVIP
ncbi:MAG: PKD domain-containing protein [Ardenticatenaceae bacterium]|nr:PKD domain-containing protein [Ardenticatenaceae bacterium]